MSFTRWRGWGASLILLVVALVLALWVVNVPGSDGTVSGGDLPGSDRPLREEIPPPEPSLPWSPRRPEPSRPSSPAYEQDTAAPVDAWPDEAAGDTGQMPEIGFLEGEITDTRGDLVRPSRGVEVIARSGETVKRLISFTGAYALALEPGRYELLAVRWDGALPARGFPESVVIEAGDREVVDLQVPAERTGGIGVVIREHPDGVLVDGVVEGTPAWEAGLQRGDVIVEVDGTPAAILNLYDFQAVMTGPEGTDIEFVISYETEDGLEEETLVLKRRFLQAPDEG